MLFLAKNNIFSKIIKLLLGCFLPPLVKTEKIKNIKPLNINIITFSVIGLIGLPIYIYSCIKLKYLSKYLKQSNVDIFTIIIGCIALKKV